MWKVSWGLSHWESHDNPTTSKIAFNDIKEAILAKEWNSFQLLGKKLDYLHLKYFFTHKCGLYLKYLLTPPQRKIIVVDCTFNHRLAIEIGRCLSALIFRDNRLCPFFSNNALANEAHYVLEYQLCNPIRDKFLPLCSIRELQIFLSIGLAKSISQRLPHSTTLRN